MVTRLPKIWNFRFSTSEKMRCWGNHFSFSDFFVLETSTKKYFWFFLEFWDFESFEILRFWDFGMLEVLWLVSGICFVFFYLCEWTITTNWIFKLYHQNVCQYMLSYTLYTCIYLFQYLVSIKAFFPWGSA